MNSCSVNFVGICTKDSKTNFLIGNLINGKSAISKNQEKGLFYGGLPFFSRYVTYDVKLEEITKDMDTSSVDLSKESTNTKKQLEQPVSNNTNSSLSIKQVTSNTIFTKNLKNGVNCTVLNNLSDTFESQIDKKTLFEKFKKYAIKEVIGMTLTKLNLSSYEILVEVCIERNFDPNIEVIADDPIQWDWMKHSTNNKTKNVSIHTWINNSILGTKVNTIETKKTKIYDSTKYIIDRKIDIITKYTYIKKWFGKCGIFFDHRTFEKFGKIYFSEINSKTNIRNLFYAVAKNPLWFICYSNQSTTDNYNSDLRTIESNNAYIKSGEFKLLDSNFKIPIIKDNFLEVLSDLVVLDIFSQTQVEIFEIAYAVGSSITKQTYKKNTDYLTLSIIDIINKIDINPSKLLLLLKDNSVSFTEKFKLITKIQVLLTNNFATINSNGDLVEIEDQKLKDQLRGLNKQMTPIIYNAELGFFELREQHIAKKYISQKLKQIIEHNNNLLKTAKNNKSNQSVIKLLPNNGTNRSSKVESSNNKFLLLFEKLCILVLNWTTNNESILSSLSQLLGEYKSVIKIVVPSNSTIGYLEQNLHCNDITNIFTNYNRRNNNEDRIKNEMVKYLIIFDTNTIDNKTFSMAISLYNNLEKIILVGNTLGINPIDLGCPYNIIIKFLKEQKENNDTKLASIIELDTSNSSYGDLVESPNTLKDFVHYFTSSLKKINASDDDNEFDYANITKVNNLSFNYKNIDDITLKISNGKLCSKFVDEYKKTTLINSLSHLPVVLTYQQCTSTQVNKLITKKMMEQVFKQKLKAFKSSSTLFKGQRIITNITMNDNSIKNIKDKQKIHNGTMYEIKDISIYLKNNNKHIPNIQVVNFNKRVYFLKNKQCTLENDMIVSFSLKDILPLDLQEHSNDPNNTEDGSEDKMVDINEHSETQQKQNNNSNDCKRKKYKKIVVDDGTNITHITNSFFSFFLLRRDQFEVAWSITIKRSSYFNYNNVYLYIPEETPLELYPLTSAYLLTAITRPIHSLHIFVKNENIIDSILNNNKHKTTSLMNDLKN